MHDSGYPQQPVEGVQTHEIGSRTYIVADVDPLDVDGTSTVAVGTGLFGLAFLVLLPFRGALARADQDWWVWTCLAGFLLGLVGWAYCLRRTRSRRAGRPRA